MTFKPGDLVQYRAFAGDLYQATVTGVHPSGCLDLDIELPGKREPFHTTAVLPERCSPRIAEPLPKAAPHARP